MPTNPLHDLLADTMRNEILSNPEYNARITINTFDSACVATPRGTKRLLVRTFRRLARQEASKKART